jgi:ferric-dicitrate binding protein FerR (iron transport regulator)
VETFELSRAASTLTKGVVRQSLLAGVQAALYCPHFVQIRARFRRTISRPETTMSTSVPPRDDNMSSALSALGDENALKQAFLAHYPALSKEAQRGLGDDALALIPKVVEGAFVRAWDARGTIRTPADLDAFLIDDVHHAAARALSRRAAAHRFGGVLPHEAHAVSGEVNPEQSWSHIQAALHGTAHSPSALSAVAAASRHDAAGHIGAVGKSQSIVLAAAVGVVVIAVIGGGMYAMNKAASKLRVTKALAASDVRVINTPAGRAGTINLGDGSTAHMAPESKLTIPKDFSGALRGVGIEGATTFDVAKGLEQQFEVHARNAIVVATGTSFTVSAYPADSQAVVVVKEGAVEVRQGDVRRPVAAGTGLVVLDNGVMRVATAEECEEASGWATGTLAVENRPLKEALTKMKRWYGYEIRVPHDSLLARKVTMRASLDSGMQAIKLIEKSSGLEFGYAGQNMVFREPGSAGGKKK